MAGGGGCGGSAATKGDPLPRGEACGCEPGPSAWRAPAASRRAVRLWGGGGGGGAQPRPDGGPSGLGVGGEGSVLK